MLHDGIVRALGTMSGTSLDGVDAAVLETDGIEIHGFGPSSYRPYTDAERQVLSAALGHWQGNKVKEAAEIVEAAHLSLMESFGPLDLAGFHGQTLAHDPGGKGTHQCGNGARLAAALGYPVVWDFRTADVAAGGQGAPLAPFYHHALSKWLGADAPLAFLNLGGVGNITWVDPACDDPADPGALLAFDTGPANAPMNDLMQARRGQGYDADGALAAAGAPDEAVVSEVLQHPYFAAPPPKSLDRDDFAGLLDAVSGLSDTDALATLAEVVVSCGSAALEHCPTPPQKLLVTGGGRHNGHLMARLSDRCACDVIPVEAVGLNGDMIEAQAFAFLAVRSAHGLPISSPQTTGVPQPMSGGQLAGKFKIAG